MKKTVKEMIEVMEAADRGEQIEMRQHLFPTGKWETTGIPIWNWATLDYRVKRKPREAWINNFGYHDTFDDIEMHRSKDIALKHACPDCTEIAVHFIEVIEE